MSKIHPDLKAEIEANAGESFEVLITLNEGTTAKSIKLEGAKNLMDNILQAKIDEKEIKRLARFKNVIAIEKDSEMGIM